MMQSISLGSRFAAASARSDACCARSAGVSPGLMWWRSTMPERCWIHSSLVSISFARSWFVTTRSGTYIPVPVSFARSPIVIPPAPSAPAARGSRRRADRSRTASHRRARAARAGPCRAAPRPRRRRVAPAIVSPTPGGSMSMRLKTSSSGVCPSWIESSTSRTAAMRRSMSGAAASTTCRSSEASAISSSVARKASTRSGGRSRMKPTVSVTITSRSRGKRSRREVVSSVANIRLATRTSLQVSARSSVLLPALV